MRVNPASRRGGPPNSQIPNPDGSPPRGVALWMMDGGWGISPSGIPSGCPEGSFERRTKGQGPKTNDEGPGTGEGGEWIDDRRPGAEESTNAASSDGRQDGGPGIPSGRTEGSSLLINVPSLPPDSSPLPQLRRPLTPSFLILYPTSLAPDLPSLVFGLWSLVFGLWSLVFGPWSLVFGLWSLVFGPWSLVLGPWSLVFGLWSFAYCPPRMSSPVPGLPSRPTLRIWKRAAPTQVLVAALFSGAIVTVSGPSAEILYCSTGPRCFA